MAESRALNDTEVAYLYAVCKADSETAYQYIRRLHRHGVIPDPPDVFGKHPNGGPCIHVWALTNRSAIKNGKCELCGNKVTASDAAGGANGKT
jgi:hypothetical protein